MWVALVDGTINDSLIIETAQGFLKNKEPLRLLYVIEISRKFPVDKEIPQLTEIAEKYLDRLEQDGKFDINADIVQSRSVKSALIALSKEDDVEGVILGENALSDAYPQEFSQIIKKILGQFPYNCRLFNIRIIIFIDYSQYYLSYQKQAKRL